MSNDPAMTTTCKVNASKYSRYLYLQKSVHELDRPYESKL